MRSFVALASLSIALLSGCVEDDASSLVVVSQNYWTVAGDFCTPSETAVVTGALNLAGPQQYEFLLLMNNFVVDDSDALLNDPNIVKPISFEVEISEFNGPKVGFPGLPNPYTVPASGTVLDSREGTNPGSGAFSGVGIPSVYGEVLEQYFDDEILQNVVLHVYVNGESLGDNSLTSDEWIWPLELRNGASIDCPGKAWVCSPGQDGNATRAPATPAESAAAGCD
jgi:hypothetical protein